jgi:UDP-glucose 4-epimerase
MSRILVTGVSSFWGGRLAQALERDERVETIIGVSPEDPTLELERTEFVRVGTQHALLRRIVQAAEIDTVIDSRLVVDSIQASPRTAHEINVIGTMNILAACGGPDSPVRKVIFKSSAHYYGCERDDPAFFTEAMQRPHAPRTRLESDIVEAENAVRGFAERNKDVTVTVLRFANGLGPELRTSHRDLLSLPAIPCILGFDPRYQFVHEDDIVGCLEFVARNDVPGVYNCAGDGVLVLSEVADLLGKPLAPVLPPWGTGAAAGLARRVGIRIPPEMVQQLKFGRGLDNRRLKAAGYAYRYTTREAIQAHAEAMRLRPLLRGGEEPYRYEREVEEFLRRSPTVRNRPEPREQRPKADLDSYEGLDARELIDLLPSLPWPDLEKLGRHESANARRPDVLAAIGRNLARTRPVTGRE